MRYRRSDIKGATYFFTVNLSNRQETLLVDNINELRESIRHAKQRHLLHNRCDGHNARAFRSESSVAK